MSFCKGYFTGEIISDIDTRYNNEDSEISKFSLKTAGVILNCNCWNTLSEAAKGLKQGDIVFLSGGILTSTYKPQNSEVSKKRFEINVRTIQKLGGVPVELTPSNFEKSNTKNSSNSNEEDISGVFSDDEELPF